MLIVRTATGADLEGVLALARDVGPGMTTIKPDRAALAARLAIAEASFAGTAAAQDRDYLFVLEDLQRGRLAGLCAIKGAVGLDEPFYNYRLGTLIHSSSEAGVFSRMEALYLCYDMTGCAELCSLFLHPDYRSGVNGRLLSKSRLLFIAQFPELFSETVFAEMRGFQAADGSSPFWEGLGRHFFKIDFNAADDLCGNGRKNFIAQLMPRHPLYTSFLSEQARAVIGKTHVDTVPARRLLEQEGLRYEGYLDIFDGGPVLQARVGQLRACRESAIAPVRSGVVEKGELLLVARTQMAGFRVIAAPATAGDGVLTLAHEAAAALDASEGPVRYMTLNPKAQQ
jgi:arginine N-succinyltransferase